MGIEKKDDKTSRVVGGVLMVEQPSDEVLEAPDKEPTKEVSQRIRVEKAFRLNEERLESLLKLSQMKYVSEKELSDFALEEGVRLTESKVGYLHFFNENSQTIELYSWSGEAMKGCTAEKDGHYPVEKAGVWADCVRLRKPVIHNDYQSLPDAKGYPEGHFRVIRHLSIPVFDNDRVVAVAGVGNKEEPYDESDVRQLSLFMNSMWRILQRKRAENALRESEERYRDLYENAPNGYFSVSAFDGSIIRFNRGALELLGYDRHMLLGMKVLDLYAETPHGKSEAQRIFERFRSGESIKDVELQMKHKDGHIIWVSLSIVPISGRDGTVLESRSMVIDISERKELERQILQTQKMESLVSLAGDIANDFHGYLSKLYENLELIRMNTREYDSIEKYMEKTKDCAKRMVRLTNQLEAYAHGGEFRPQKLSLNDLVRAALPSIKERVVSNLEVTTELADDLQPVPVVPGQLQLVLTAVLINATEAQKPGGWVHISTRNKRVDETQSKGHPRLPPGSYVCLRIEDGGEGMDEETKNRIFEPFFSTKARGRGLGMAAVYGIVKRHGGDVVVDSEKEKGTVVAIYLPAIEGRQPSKP